MKNKIFKNKSKRSNVPIILFVIGVFTICAFALLTFFLSDFNMANSFVGIDVMKTLSAQHEEYSYYLDQGVPEMRADSYFNVSQDVGGKYLVMEVSKTSISPSFSSSWKKQELLFSAKYYLP